MSKLHMLSVASRVLKQRYESIDLQRHALSLLEVASFYDYNCTLLRRSLTEIADRCHMLQGTNRATYECRGAICCKEYLGTNLINFQVPLHL